MQNSSRKEDEIHKATLKEKLKHSYYYVNVALSSVANFVQIANYKISVIEVHSLLDQSLVNSSSVSDVVVQLWSLFQARLLIVFEYAFQERVHYIAGNAKNNFYSHMLSDNRALYFLETEWRGMQHNRIYLQRIPLRKPLVNNRTQ